MDRLACVVLEHRREVSWITASVELKVDELSAKRALFACAPLVLRAIAGQSSRLLAVFNGPSSGTETVLYQHVCQEGEPWPPTAALKEVYGSNLDHVFVQTLLLLPNSELAVDPAFRSADETFHDVNKHVADALAADQLYIGPFASTTLCKLKRRTIHSDVKMAVATEKPSSPAPVQQPSSPPRPTPASPPHKKPRKVPPPTDLFPADEQTTPPNAPSPPQARGGTIRQPPSSKVVSELAGGKLSTSRTPPPLHPSSAFKTVDKSPPLSAAAPAKPAPAKSSGGTLDSFFSRMR